MKALLAFLPMIVLAQSGISAADESINLPHSRLNEIREEAQKYTERAGHVLNEDQISKNASKSDPKSYDRRIYLKLPLYDVKFHWVFLEKAKLLAGDLTLTIKRGDTTETFVIFHHGAISSDWEALDCCAQGPEQMYFGFTSKKSLSLSELDTAFLRLSVKSDIKGIGPDMTGTLKRGDYASFSQPRIYHLEKSTGEKDVWAFFNYDGWNILWKLDETSHLGWMQNKIPQRP